STPSAATCPPWRPDEVSRPAFVALLRAASAARAPPCSPRASSLGTISSMAPRTLLPLLLSAVISFGAASCGGAAQAAQTPAKPAASNDDPPPDKFDDTATIDAYCNPPSQILVDGKPAGMSPVTGFKVKPGSHDVTFVDEVTGNRTMTMVLEPGEG